MQDKYEPKYRVIKETGAVSNFLNITERGKEDFDYTVCIDIKQLESKGEAKQLANKICKMLNKKTEDEWQKKVAKERELKKILKTREVLR